MVTTNIELLQSYQVRARGKVQQPCLVASTGDQQYVFTVTNQGLMFVNLQDSFRPIIAVNFDLYPIAMFVSPCDRYLFVLFIEFDGQQEEEQYNGKKSVRIVDIAALHQYAN